MPANLFYSLRSIFFSYFYSFKESFLYYPIVFAIGGFVLFLLTSRLDELIGRNFYVDGNLASSYLEPLLFAGSPNAARSILSTIATGWATILGVAFSVTLITLQLSVTKYTSEIINEFENSRTNQLTLALFILTVTYSMLVLKTVRTGEDGASIFTPILGVNISVYLAVIALFIFVLFLHNISSYLRPDSLIDRIVDRVHRSVRQYESRVPDSRFIFKTNDHTEMREIMKVRSPRDGIIRSVDWRKISNDMERQVKLQRLKHQYPGLWLEWLSTIGDQVKKDQVVAKAYIIEDDSPAAALGLETRQKDTNKALYEAIFSGLDIGRNRRMASDPCYGIEVLRNIATKAINQSDIASITSCISGLLEIFHMNTHIRQSAAAPFMLPLMKRNNPDGQYLITVNTREKDVAEEALSQLSAIYHISSNSEECRFSVAEHLAKNYVRLGAVLLEESKTNEFEKLTEWYSLLLSHAKSPHPQFNRRLKNILAAFSNDLSSSHPYAVDTVRIHLDRIFASEA